MDSVNSMSDPRPVIDYYKNWETEAIRADLDTKRFNYSVLCCNVQGDFNIGSIIRNANAFLASKVLIYGKRKWDRRGAVGSHHYLNLQHVDKVDDLSPIKTSFVVAVDNCAGAVPITEFEWPQDEHVVMIFGEEAVGIPEDIVGMADAVVSIPQYGACRSINVACASAIAMQDYCRKVVT